MVDSFQLSLDGVNHTSTYGTSTPGTALADVLGAADAERFKKIGLNTIGDYLGYYPRKWEPNGTYTESIWDVPDGVQVVLPLVVERTVLKPKKGSHWQKLLNVACTTPVGEQVSFTVWNQPAQAAEKLPEGTNLLASGVLKTFGGGGVRSLDRVEYALGGRRLLRPVRSIYPGKAVAPREWIEELSEAILGALAPLPEHLPENILSRRSLPTYDAAIRALHLPASVDDAYMAQERLTYDEALATQLTIALSKVGASQKVSRSYPYRAGGFFDAYVAALPYELTGGQKETIRQIAHSMGQTHPMNALLLGDVGSGKTTVAALALLLAVDSGGQGALIAPTEVLAEQHYKGLAAELEPLGVKVGLVTGSVKGAGQKELLTKIATGELDVLIGTHSLLSEKIIWHNLGVAVVDEQHRFGVEQRNKLRDRTPSPHMLVMTATPIPRTIAMTTYGDLDVYELKGVPAGRKPVVTHVVPTSKPAWVGRTWQVMGEHIANGRQIFIVGALIEKTGKGRRKKPKAGEPEPVDPLTVEQIAALAAQNLPAARIGVVHGKLTSEEKDQVMTAFAAGHLDILVSTTVIEVGVNVPNSTIMCVWDADRFGMAQLHQLRGRVGRGQHEGLCLLVTNMGEDTDSYQRLEAVASTTNGFKIAQLDLEARKEGDLLSTSQAGRNKLKLLSLENATNMVAMAREDAVEVAAGDPALRRNPALKDWLASMISSEQAQALLKN